MLLAAGAALAAAAASGRIAWRDLPPLPLGVAGGAIGALEGGKVVYAGGTTWLNGVKHWLPDVRVYDPAGNSWRVGPELPEALAYGGQVSSPYGLEVLGGLTQDGPSRNCWRWDGKLVRWSNAGVLPQDSVLSRVERIANADYLFGGCSDAAVPMHCSSLVWKRAAGGTWERAGEMPDGAVALRATAVLDGRVYLFGGCSEVSKSVVNRDHAYRYDPATGEWRKLKPLPAAARGIAAASLGAGRILLAGGYSASGGRASKSGPEFGFWSDVWVYDAGSDLYQRATSLPFAVSGMGILAHDGMILAIGGEDRMRGRSRRFLHGKIE